MITPNKIMTTALLYLLLLAAGIPAAAKTVKIRPSKVTAALRGGSLVIARGNRELFRLTGVVAETFKAEIPLMYGFFRPKKSDETTRALSLRHAGSAIELAADGKRVGETRIETTAGGNLRVAVTLDDSLNASGMRLDFACAPRDRFWGFGEQYSFVDLRGREVPVWVSEEGVGRAENPNMPFIGKLSDTYFPMPYFMDPAQGKGLLIENTEFSRFDLCKSDAARWSVDVWNGRRALFLVFAGPQPADVVRQLTAEVGRPIRVPPDWALRGVWLGAQGGREAVEARLKTALDAGIPVSAVWAQDWVGRRHFGGGNYGVKYRWSLDPDYYPDFTGMVREMRKRNVRFLGYFNPFVLPDYELWKTAVDNNYIIRNPAGDPYVFQIVVFKGSLLDASNPAAAKWFKSFANKATALGISGWMADFGEWLPFDAKIANGDPRSAHNLYPTAWHRLNREALEAAYPGGDFVMLTRSGYTGEQRVADVVWAGDQEADWSETDGLPTVVRAGLTLGLAGVPFFTHDIAGFSGGPSTKELFMRWTELGAFTPVMRTHDGLKKLQNHRFDTDPETLAHFKRMALIHAALLPYFQSLGKESMATGLPIIRHTALVDPEWPAALDAHAQWMLGADMMFAPVVKQGAADVEVSFPKGAWENLFTGKRYSGRHTERVAAPIGTPAVFVREGKLAPIVRAIREIK